MCSFWLRGRDLFKALQLQSGHSDAFCAHLLTIFNTLCERSKKGMLKNQYSFF